MKNLFQFSYTKGHEIPRNRTKVGKAAPAGYPSGASGKKSIGSSTSLKYLCKLGISLVPDITRERFRVTPQRLLLDVPASYSSLNRTNW
jgi:hypothetical protein